MFRTDADTGSLMNLNWFKFTGKGAAVTAPPEVNATAEPVTGEAPLERRVQRDATDAEGEAMTYAWDFGVPGTDTDKSTAGGAELHLHDAGQLHGDRDGDRRVRRQVLGHGRGPRHAAARRVPDGPGPLGRVRRQRARQQRWTVDAA